MTSTNDHASARRGFDPIVGNRPRVLVLGSMPSEASLDSQQYYGHPRNAFWPIMARLFHWPEILPYHARCAALTEQGVALWDVIGACVRPGSADAAIVAESVEPNPIAELLQAEPGISALIFNGTTAAREFRRRILPGLTPAQQRIARHQMPSTSPAMARLSVEQKAEEWRLILTLLKTH